MENPEKSLEKKTLKKPRLNCIVPGICSVLFGALLLCDLYLNLSDKWNFPVGLTGFLGLGLSLQYSACAWSRLTFAMKKRLPWFTGVPFFAATLFHVWSAIWLLYVRTNFRLSLESHDTAESVTWWAIFALVLQSWIVMLVTVIVSARSGGCAAAEGSGDTRYLAKIRRWRIISLASTAAVFLLAVLGIFWLKSFLFYIIPRMDRKKYDFFDLLLMYKMTVIFTSIALALALSWGLYAWNRLMLEARRHFLVQFGVMLLAEGAFLTAFFMLVFNNLSFVPLAPFAVGAAVMAVDALLTFRIREAPAAPAPETVPASDRPQA